MTADEKAIAEAEQAGFDLSLVDLNLRLTPTERCRQHDLALGFVMELQQARTKKDARLHAIDPSPR